MFIGEFLCLLTFKAVYYSLRRRHVSNEFEVLHLVMVFISSLKKTYILTLFFILHHIRMDPRMKII